MDAQERARMEAMGYAVVDDAADWLGLDEVERQVVDFRVRLGREVRRRRAQAGHARGDVTDPTGSCPSPYPIEEDAGGEEGDGLEFLMREFFATGGRVADLATI